MKKIIILIIVIIVVGLVLFSMFRPVEKQIKSVEVVEALSTTDYAKIRNILKSSNFIADMPEKGAISLRFFTFEEGRRVWQSGFLLTGKGILESGEADIYLTLDSKYISELNEDNLCEVIRKAKQNDDLGFYSEKSKAGLMLRYVGMLKYRKCFGF